MFLGGFNVFFVIGCLFVLKVRQRFFKGFYFVLMVFVIFDCVSIFVRCFCFWFVLFSIGFNCFCYCFFVVVVVGWHWFGKFLFKVLNVLLLVC